VGGKGRRGRKCGKWEEREVSKGEVSVGSKRKGRMGSKF